MVELVTAVRDYAAWLYLLVVVLVVRELLAMRRAGRDRGRAMFGLEREAATSRAMRSLVMLLLLFTIGAGVYTVSRWVAPSLPERERRLADEAPIIEPPMPIGLPSDTPVRPTRAPTAPPPRIVTAVPVTEESTTPEAPPALCRNPNVDIVSPSSGTVLTGDTPVVVTVRFEPSTGQTFGLDLGAGADPQMWVPLGGPFAAPATEQTVLSLSPAGLAAGIYSLRLSLAQPDGSVPEGDVCLVALRVP